MPKGRTTLKVRLPVYVSPRNEWRRAIVRAVKRKQKERGVGPLNGNLVELRIRLYLADGGEEIHDVDNRLKDIMDALQGRLGGPKGIERRWWLLENDHQVRRVVIEKLAPPKQSIGQGHLVVRRYRNGASG
jgi:hypothetical protein